MSSATTEVLRLFLALWPDDVTRDRIAAIGHNAAGKHAIRPANLHLTLVFLGATPAGRRQCYEHVLYDLPVPSLQIHLNRLGYWPDPGILWLGPDRTSDKLGGLVCELNLRLSRCGFQPERDFDRFRAHVTLARKYKKIPPLLQEIGEPFYWHADQIVLVKSITDSGRSHYEIIGRW